MYVLLKNSGWLQYHLIDAFLDDGIQVDHLVREGDEAEHDLFFARNSLYGKCEKVPRRKYDAALFLGGFDDGDVSADRFLLINPDSSMSSRSIPNNSKKTVIIAPMLFGEWMPITENGIMHMDTFIPFDSTEFQKHAIHARDFAAAMLQWLKIPQLPEMLEAFPSRNMDAATRLANSIGIRENKSIEERIMILKKHDSFTKSISKYT